MTMSQEELIALGRRADEHAGAGRYREAEADYLEMHRNAPREPEVLRRLALVQSQLGRHREAEASIAKALRHAPEIAMVHNSAGLVRLRAGAFAEAIGSYRRSTQLSPRSAALWCGLATALERTHDLDGAEQAVDSALTVEPGHTQASAIKGALLRRRGDAGTAVDLLENAVAGSAPDAFRIDLCAELGHALDRLGRSDEAFAAWSDANRAATEHRAIFRAFNADRPFGTIERATRITPEQFARWKSEPAPNDGVRAAFLVGMPRSGTTMTEQILSAHPQVLGSGELPILARVFDRLRVMYGDTPMFETLDRLTADQIAQLRRIYADHAGAMLSRAGKGKTLLLDKNPMQILSAPFLSRVFPDAKVIVALRDPRDVCLSCFQQRFSPNNATLNFLDLDRTARLYAAVMGMWLAQRDHHAFAHHELRYEDLTADFEPSARTLVSFLGLAWDKRVLTFHEHAPVRPINTPSYEAITQPVHTKAAGRWKRYAAQLAPILPTLEPFVGAFGYEPSGGTA